MPTDKLSTISPIVGPRTAAILLPMAHRLPVGIQDFAQLREGGFVYVDKTQHIFELIDQGVAYFLSRPRRFGKSLLLSAIGYLFEGREDLFRGLWIHDHWDWAQRWPVVRISLGAGNFRAQGGTRAVFRTQIAAEAERHGIALDEDEPALAFAELLRALRRQGPVPVVLIDEYDKPVLQVLEQAGSDDAQLEDNRRELCAFYSVLKDAAPHFLLLTGVSRLTKASVFSEMNHLEDITWARLAAGLCGFTRREMEHAFAQPLEAWATEQESRVPTILDTLRDSYNGFRFAPGTETIFNPFSSVMAIKQQHFGRYWTETGTPEFLVRLMVGSGIELTDVERVWMPASALMSLDPLHPDPLPLLLQTGYLTILDHNTDGDLLLGFPNQEVRSAFVQHLLLLTANHGFTETAPRARAMGKALQALDIDAFLTHMQWVFSGIPYQLDDAHEKRYHGLFHALAMLACSPPGMVHSESSVACARTDLVLDMPNATWVCEFKRDQAPALALAQIEERGYAQPWQGRGKPVYRVGISFDSAQRSISAWQIAGPDNGG